MGRVDVGTGRLHGDRLDGGGLDGGGVDGGGVGDWMENEVGKRVAEVERRREGGGVDWEGVDRVEELGDDLDGSGGSRLEINDGRVGTKGDCLGVEAEPLAAVKVRVALHADLDGAGEESRITGVLHTVQVAVHENAMELGRQGGTTRRIQGVVERETKIRVGVEKARDVDAPIKDLLEDATLAKAKDVAGVRSTPIAPLNRTPVHVPQLPQGNHAVRNLIAARLVDLEGNTEKWKGRLPPPNLDLPCFDL